MNSFSGLPFTDWQQLEISCVFPMEVGVYQVLAQFRMVAPLRAAPIQPKAATSHATV